MSDQNPSYTDAVKDAARRGGLPAADPGTPLPDAPTGVVYLNPALNPAPEWTPQPERVVVPVINDPGVVGAGPSLAELNRAYREGDLDRDGVKGSIDDTLGSEGNAEAIRAAAQARIDQAGEDAEDAADEAVAASKPTKTTKKQS